MEARYDFHRALAQVSDTTRVIKVGMANGSCKRLRLDESMSAASLVQAMGEKLGLDEASYGLFAIWVRGKEVDLAVQLPSDVNPADVIENWAHWELEFKGHTSGTEPLVEFKRAEFVSTETEAGVEDPRARELFFEEAVADVRSSMYVVDKDLTVEVLALAVYATTGAFKKSVHKKGYFTGKEHNLARITPVHMGTSRKFKAGKWEKAMLKAWAKIDPETSPVDARERVVDLLRSRCPYYSACFYSVAGLERNKANKRAKAVGDLVLAITEAHVHVLPAKWSSRDKPLITMDRLAPEFNFRKVNTASDGVVLEFHHKDPKREEHQTFEFATRETALIITHLRHLDTPMLMNVSKFVDELLHLMTLEDYSEGEYIVRTGDPGRCMYFVSSGTIEIEIPSTTPDAPFKTVTLREGSYFGEIALFLSKTGRRTASVRAATAVQLLVLTKETCNSVLHRFPHMEKAFRELGSARLRNNDSSSSKESKPQQSTTPSWMKRISGKVTKRKGLVESSGSSSPAIRSKTSQRPRFLDPPTEPTLHPIPGAPDPELLPVIDTADKWDGDVPRRVFAPRSDPFVSVIEDPLPEINWFARIFCGQVYSLFMAKVEDAVVLVSIFVSAPPGGSPTAARNIKPTLLSTAGPPSLMSTSSLSLGGGGGGGGGGGMDDDPFDVDAALKVDGGGGSLGTLQLPMSSASLASLTDGEKESGSDVGSGSGGDAPVRRRRASTIVGAQQVESSRASGQVSHLYWVIVWEKKALRRRVLEAESPLGLQQILGHVDPVLGTQIKAFRKVDPVDVAVEKALCTIENGEPDLHFKLGSLFAMEGQDDENDMFGNKDGSVVFNQFMSKLGDRVRLKGYSGYCAQLDTKFDKSGLFSYKTSFGGYEVMFHVSTELQYDPTDDQFIQRKRFIGNDIVVIVFVDGTTTYSVETMKSQYTNILLVAQPDPENPTRYRIRTCRQRGLRRFGPVAAEYYRKDDPGFAKFVLAKALNGEHATYVSPEFLVRDRRTRNNLLNDFYETYAESCKKSHVLSGGGDGSGSSGGEGASGAAVAPAAAVPSNPHGLVPFESIPLIPAQAYVPTLVDTSRCAQDPNAVCVVRGVLFIGTSDGLYASRGLHNVAPSSYSDEINAFPPTLVDAAASVVEAIGGAVPTPGTEPGKGKKKKGGKGGDKKSLDSGLARIATLDHIIALKGDRRHNALFALTGGPAGRLFEFSLTELLRGQPAVITMIPHSKGVSTFDAGWVRSRFYLCAGTGDKVVVYTVRSDGSYREAETLVLPSRVAVVSLTQYGVLVGTEEEGTTPSQFMFFSLETDRTFLYDPVHVCELSSGSLEASSSSASTVMFSSLLSAATSSLYWSGLLAEPEPERMIPSRPIDCLVAPHGVILAYAHSGVFLAHNGFVEHTVEWNGEAVSFATAGPFFAVYYRTFVEIRSVDSGALIETHYARLAGPFACSGDELLFLAVDYVDGVLSDPQLYHLEPIEEVDYTSPDLEVLLKSLAEESAAAAENDDGDDPTVVPLESSLSDLSLDDVFDDESLAEVDVNALASLWETKFES